MSNYGYKNWQTRTVVTVLSNRYDLYLPATKEAKIGPEALKAFTLALIDKQRYGISGTLAGELLSGTIDEIDWHEVTATLAEE